MNTKGILPILGIGMAAGAAIGMAIKPKDQALIKQKANQAVKTVGDTMENVIDSIKMH